MGVRRLGPGFVVFITHEDDLALYAHIYRPNEGWLPPQAVTAPAANVNSVARDTNKSAAIFVWADPSGVTKASVFDGESWKVHELASWKSGLGASASVGRKGHVVGWAVESGVYAAHFSLTEGWREPIKLGDGDGGQTVEVDASGNAIAAWAAGGAIAWRRASHVAADWSDPQRIEDQDAINLDSSVDASGNVMLLWSNPLGVWASRFE